MLSPLLNIFSSLKPEALPTLIYSFPFVILSCNSSWEYRQYEIFKVLDKLRSVRVFKFKLNLIFNPLLRSIVKWSETL